LSWSNPPGMQPHNAAGRAFCPQRVYKYPTRLRAFHRSRRSTRALENGRVIPTTAKTTGFLQSNRSEYRGTSSRPTGRSFVTG
jgi:hypothetical protein